MCEEVSALASEATPERSPHPRSTCLNVNPSNPQVTCGRFCAGKASGVISESRTTTYLPFHPNIQYDIQCPSIQHKHSQPMGNESRQLSVGKKREPAMNRYPGVALHLCATFYALDTYIALK